MPAVAGAARPPCGPAGARAIAVIELGPSSVTLQPRSLTLRRGVIRWLDGDTEQRARMR